MVSVGRDNRVGVHNLSNPRDNITGVSDTGLLSSASLSPYGVVGIVSEDQKVKLYNANDNSFSDWSIGADYGLKFDRANRLWALSKNRVVCTPLHRGIPLLPLQ